MKSGNKQAGRNIWNNKESLLGLLSKIKCEITKNLKEIIRIERKKRFLRKGLDKRELKESRER